MGYFMESPLQVLPDMEDVRKFIALPRPNGCDSFRIKSVWIVGLIDEISARGEYPYNATVKRLAMDRLGMPRVSDAEYAREGDALSLLVYNAQCFRRSDMLRADGFKPFTDELLTEAGAGGRIELLGSNMLGGQARSILKVRDLGGKLYAMPPKARNRYLSPSGQPGRVVAV